MCRFQSVFLLFWAIFLVSACGSDPNPSGDAGSDVQDTSVDDVSDTDEGGDTSDDAVDAPDAATTDGRPAWPVGTEINTVPTGPTSVRLSWGGATDDVGVIAFEVLQDGERLARLDSTRFSYPISALDPETTYSFSIVALDQLAQRSDPLSVTYRPVTPAPEDVAPDLPPTLIPTVDDLAETIVGGDDPVQRDVAPDAIDARRVAIIRGRVVDKSGAPIGGVHVRVHDDAALGYTLTRADGVFDIVVNGGGPTTLTLRADGYMTVQREYRPGWRDTVSATRIVMLAYDPNVTSVDLSQPGQVATGSVIDDGDGERQGVLIFRQGTGAEMVLPNGTRQALTNIDVRISEYTDGATGPDAMPGALPPTTAYTYAVNLTIDEAEDAGALRVDFDQTVAYYVDNFMDYAVGEPVPNGYYDFQRAVWVPDNEGRIVEILSVANGRAVLDIDGEGEGATQSELAALDITDEELEALASVRSAGDLLWRVPLEHFTAYDHNWGVGCSPGQDCIGPDGAKVLSNDQKSCQFGSIVDCGDQTLRETIDVPGTTIDLHYSTYFQHGFLPKRSFEADLGTTVPEEYSNIVIGIGGQSDATAEIDESTGTLPAAVWDGTLHGQRYNAGKPATGYVGYCYAMVRSGASFGSVPRTPGVEITASAAPDAIRRGNSVDISACGSGTFASGGGGGGFFAFFKSFPITLEGWSSPGQHMGGWTLEPHHFYDRGSDILYRGDGTRQEQTRGIGVETYAGIYGELGDSNFEPGPVSSTPLRNPTDIAFAPDGTAFILETTFNRVLRDRDGELERVAGDYRFVGNGWVSSGFNGDGRPATDALLDGPRGIAVGPDGALYIADTKNNRIRRVDPQTQEINTVAGVGGPNSLLETHAGDGGPATEARLHRPEGVAIGPGGDLYIADTGNDVIRRVGTDGVIETIAGQPTQSGFDGDGGMSREARLNVPRDVDVAPDGTIYIADTGNRRIRRIQTNGFINTIAGSGNAFAPTGRDGLALEVALDQPAGVAVSPDGRVFVAENSRVFEIRDGMVSSTIGRCWPVSDGCLTTGNVGNGEFDPDGEFGPDTRLGSNVPGVGVDPVGRVYAADTINHVIRRIGRKLEDVDESSIIVRSEDGAELYIFDEDGLHLETRSSTGGAPLFTFDYDDSGLLIRISDADGLETEIERGPDGYPQAIVGPWGDRTALTVEGAGFDAELRTVVSETGRQWQLEYQQDRLLTRKLAPGGREHTFTYDASGRLVGETEPGGASKTLSRTSVVGEDIIEGIELIDGAGWSRKYLTRRGQNDQLERVEVGPNGLETVTTIRDDSRSTTTSPDGTVLRNTLSQDARLASLGAYVSSTEERSPGGVVRRSSYVPEYEFDDPTSAVPTRVIRRTGINGREWVEDYDVTNGVLTSTTPEGRTSTSRVDALGRIVERDEPGRHTIRNQYDARGRLTQTEYGDSVTLYEYDSEGNFAATVVREAGTTTELSRTARTYDADGRLASLTRPDGTTVNYVWNDADHITGITLPGGVTHTFTRSLAGNLTSSTKPNGEVSRWEWDAGGNMTRQVMPSGTTTDFSYDTASRLDLVESGTQFVDYQYDTQTGHPVVMVDDAGERLDFEYDGRLQTSEAWSGTVSGRVDVSWNSDYQVARRSVDNANPINYKYDRDGLLTEAGSLQLTYAPGMVDVASTTLGDVRTTILINQQGQVGGYAASFRQAPLMDVSQLHDVFDDITTRVETIDGVTTTYDYDYDAVGRLTEVREDGALVESYTYDARGNRVASERDGVAQTGTYNDNDELISYAGMNYGYDADGNVTFTERASDGAQRTEFSWGPLATLDAVDLPDGRLVEYVSDPKGRRVAKFVDGVMERGWLYQDLINPIVELDGAGNVRSRFVYGVFRHVPDYMMRDGRTYRLLHDANGSVRLVVDVADGTIIQRIDYDAWGRVLSDTNPGFQPFGFAGGLRDTDTGLVQFGARHYDPFSGRWTQTEPLGFEHGTVNLYEYAWGSPLKFVDADGELAWFIPIGISIAVSMILDAAIQQATKGCINWWQVGLSGVLGAVTGGVGTLAKVAIPRLTLGMTLRLTALEGAKTTAKRGIGNVALSQASQIALRGVALKKAATEVVAGMATNALNGGISTVGMNLGAGKTALNTGENGMFNGVAQGAGSSVLTGALGGAVGGRTTKNLTSRYYSETYASVAGEFSSAAVSGLPIKFDLWTGP